MGRLFRLTPQGQEQLKRMMFRKMLQEFGALEVILFAVCAWFWEMSVAQVVGLLIITLLMVVVFWVRTWHNPALRAADWELYVDDEQVYLTENKDSPRILREHVTRTSESKYGLTVHGRTFFDRLFIPRGVEDYEMLKREISSWPGNS
ncbi:MAG: hypothetical protein AB1473_22405 [Thermodesulfobacteriota bacterium]